MVVPVQGFRVEAAGGRTFDNWFDAAEAECATMLKAILPDWGNANPPTRDELALDMARVLFIERDQQATMAMGQILRLYQTAPKHVPQDEHTEHLTELSMPRIAKPRKASGGLFRAIKDAVG